jgi:geranylgeranyl diphosphate synthase, type I
VKDFSPDLDQLRTRVDRELFDFLERITKEVEGSETLVEEITTLLDAGGKRLRPSFCYWGHRAGGGEDSEPIVRVASALELLHTFALVHDDIMDASEERRGLPTAHVRLGVGEALLIGDLALVLADDLFMRSGFSADSLNRAFETYSRMRKQVIVGQHLELGLTAVEEVDEDEVRLVARMKSGRYSIREPLLIGACLGPRGERIIDALGEFGELLGEAFQIRDDLLGVFGSREEIGKPVDSDVREGKKNIVFATTVRMLEGGERDFFLSHWGRRRGPDRCGRGQAQGLDRDVGCPRGRRISPARVEGQGKRGPGRRRSR